jgi:hypothetical protein
MKNGARFAIASGFPRPLALAALAGLAFSLLGRPVSSHSAETAFASAVPQASGYLFLNGEYVLPPYQIAFDDHSLTINGLQFTEDSFDLSAYESEVNRQFTGMRGRRRMQDEGRWGRGPGIRRTGFQRGGFEELRRAPRRPFDVLCEEVAAVSTGAIVVLYEHASPASLYPTGGTHEFLQTLVAPSVTKFSLPTSLAGRAEGEVLARLAGEFRPTAEFSSRAAQDIGKVDAASAEADRVTAGNLWIDKISYPLTVLAMALVVLGFGHLLSNRPQLDESESADEAKRRKVVGQSLLIVGLLSAVDLIWTIGTANAGLMRELNPLGSGLIAEPIKLFLFKATLTGASIGILYWLHRRPVAQLASWWCCLLLTLLTARWVVFQSMFL